MVKDRAKEKSYYNASEYWEWRARKYGSSYKGWRAIYLISADEQFFEYNDMLDKQAVSSFVRVKPGMEILDVGCGVGRWCMEFARKGAHVTGIDISEEMIRIAQQNMEYEDLACNLMVSGLDAINLPDNSFDLVNCISVLMHITDPEKFQKSCREMVRVTRPGGQILLKEWVPRKGKSIRNFEHIVGRPHREFIETLEREGVSLIKERGIHLSLHINNIYGAIGDRLAKMLRKKVSYVDETSDNEEFIKAAYPKLLKPFHLGRRVLIMISKPIELYLVPLWPIRNLSDTRIMLFRKGSV
jgi:SAM-dependent methyltransferase